MRACDFFERYQDSNPQPQPRAYFSLPLNYIITCDQQWDIFLLSSLSNVLYNLFHSYNDLKWKTFQLQSCRSGGELQLSYIRFFHLRSFKNFKIWNSNFKLYIWVPKQPQLKKILNYKVVDLVEAYNFCIDEFLIGDNLNFSKIACSNINKNHKGEAPWCCTSPMSSQRWRDLMLPVTFYLSKSVIYTILIGDVV